MERFIQTIAFETKLRKEQNRKCKYDLKKFGAQTRVESGVFETPDSRNLLCTYSLQEVDEPLLKKLLSVLEERYQAECEWILMCNSTVYMNVGPRPLPIDEYSAKVRNYLHELDIQHKQWENFCREYEESKYRLLYSNHHTSKIPQHHNTSYLINNKEGEVNDNENDNNEKPIINDLMPMFFNVRQNVVDFLNSIDGQINMTAITNVVNEYVSEGKIAKANRKGELWNILHEKYHLYKRSESTWNRNVN